jgi:hypothetical protein
MSPNSVFGPVVTTMAVPVPLTTDVPRKIRCAAFGPVPAGGSAVGEACLSAGSDSPVSIDC